jgi:hypothetical protein
MFLFTVVYIYNLSLLALLGQINSQQDNGITLAVAYIVFVDNDINVLASPVNARF